jgi:hypothetical protein
MRRMNAFTTMVMVGGLLAMGAAARDAGAAEGGGADPGGGKKPTLAVLPFLADSAKEKALAERMRFAVSQKLSTDTEGRVAGGAFDRMDNVQVEQTISALQISFAGAGKGPSDDEMQQVLGTLGTDYTIGGTVKGRTLSLTLYKGTAVTKEASVEIPPDKESPKLAVEKVLTELTGTTFAHIRDVEVDHSDAAAEARFKTRPNLVVDGDFRGAAAQGKAASWEAILGSDSYAPPVLNAGQAKGLGMNKVAVVPKSAAGVAGGGGDGYCLMMRMGKEVAENNGLACASTWIPVEQGKKYRFTVQYHSTGPVSHIFLKGFGVKADQYGSKEDPEAVRREFYRAQVLPRNANSGWDLIEMDFTPSTVKASDPKIEWLRVDLYVYLKPGDIWFGDVVVKKVGE